MYKNTQPQPSDTEFTVINLNENTDADDMHSVCRICLEPSNTLHAKTTTINENDPIKACDCKQLPHIICLAEQLKHKPQSACEICNANYLFDDNIWEKYFKNYLPHTGVEMTRATNVNIMQNNMQNNVIDTENAEPARLQRYYCYKYNIFCIICCIVCFCALFCFCAYITMRATI